jgi:hypothetical protein
MSEGARVIPLMQSAEGILGNQPRSWFASLRVTAQ